MVGESTHGTDHFNQLQIADTQADGRHCVNRAFHTHTASLRYDGIRAKLVHQIGRNPVVGLRQGPFQGHLLSYSSTRVARRPHLSVFQLNVVLDIRDSRARRVFTFLHGQRIKERLEGGTHLTACLRDVVVLEKTIIQTTHVGLHMASVRLDRNQASLQEPLVVAYRIHRRHDRVDGAIPGENGHRHRTVKLSLDGVQWHTLILQDTITVGALHRSLKDMVDFVSRDVGEWRILLAFPMLVEHRLQFLTHKLFDGFLGIMLHPRINGGVDAQTIAIDVVRLTVGTGGVFGPFVQLASQELTEIGGLACVVVLDAEMRHIDGNQRDGITFSLGDKAIFGHLFQHEVTAAQRTLRVAHRAETGGCIDHTSHQGTLLNGHLLGFLVEEGARRRTDAVSIVTESHSVEIHRNDFLFRIVVLQLGGRNPFLELAQHELGLAQVLATRKQVFGQLLRNGGAATFVFARDDTESHTEQSPLIDA